MVNYIGAVFFYFTLASASYYLFFVWKKERFYPATSMMTRDPKELARQVRTEIGIAMRSFPVMSVAFSPFTFGVTRGWSKMYHDVGDYGWGYFFLSIILFLVVTDCMIYWIHLGLHTNWMYQNVHKPHHTYRFTTPYSSHAFHWADGFAQGIPYYIFVYLFPLQSTLWLALFMFVNFWTIMIHDQVDFTGHLHFIQSTGHHTIHHRDFKYNYGQYFTFWDYLNGTLRNSPRTHDWHGNRVPEEKSK
uniref:Fatty acid hydroxylase domain-containing protein n=1 Tax=Arcella intermedia TaxID=1963864 RepID=A0A6B2LDP0_9EUKA